MNSIAHHRLGLIRQILSTTYPQASIELIHTSPWELLVAVMLSAQCKDSTVNDVTPVLFRIYPTILEITRANISDIERIIHKTGFYRVKAKHIQESGKQICMEFDGKVPQRMEELIRLPGVGRKTANIVLSNAYGIHVGIAVDTHVARVSQRLRLLSMNKRVGSNPKYIRVNNRVCIDYFTNPNPEYIESRLMDIMPQSEWNTITYQCIAHGRAICDAKKPKCGRCVLSSLCPVSRSK